MGTRSDKLIVQECIKTFWSRGVTDKYKLGIALLNFAFCLQDMNGRPELVKEYRRYAQFCVDMKPEAFKNAIEKGELL